MTWLQGEWSELLQDQIYESFIHDPFEWIWLWKLTNWMDDGFFHTLSP